MEKTLTPFAKHPKSRTFEGTYIYTQNGEMRVREPWSITYETPQNRRIVCDRISTEFGIHIHLDASETPLRRDYDFTFTDLNTESVNGAGQYRFETGNMHFRSDPDTPWQIEPMNGRVFFPLMRVFTGDVLRAILASCGRAETIVPYIEDPSQHENLFTPTVSERKVRDLHTNPASFEYEGGQYANPICIELGPHGFLRRYRWQIGDDHWECALQDFNAA